MGLAGKIKNDPNMSANTMSGNQVPQSAQTQPQTQYNQMPPVQRQTQFAQTQSQQAYGMQPQYSQVPTGQPQFSQHPQPYPTYNQPQMQPAPLSTAPHMQYPQTQPHQPYGQPQAYPSYAQSPMMQSGNNVQALQQKLQTIVSQNHLEAFYDQTRFQQVLQRVCNIDFDQIAAQWKISKELAYDLAPLALYDIVFFCDDSGSMIFDENGERVDDLKFILSRVADIGTKFDDDGIVVRFMNCDVNGDGIRNAADVQNLVTKVKFGGITPLGTNLDRKVIQPFVIGQARSNNMAKPILAVVITDGEPTGESRDTLVQVIKRAKDVLSQTRYGPGAFALQIAQVGKDSRALRFLEQLDNDPVVGKMIDCTSYFELEAEEFARKGVNLTPDLWLLKMCVGAIDPSYDAMD